MSLFVSSLSRTTSVIPRQVSQARHMSIITSCNRKMLAGTSNKVHTFTHFNFYRRWYSSDSPKVLDKSEKFYNYTKGGSYLIGAIIAFLGMKYGNYYISNDVKKLEKENGELKDENQKIKTLNERYEQKLGITDLIILPERTHELHAQFLSKTEKKLRLIGTSGNRIVAKIDSGIENPIRKTIIQLLLDGKDVRLIIYDPESKNMDLPKDVKSKIDKSISEAKEIQTNIKQGKFQVKLINEPPPFLGDIIDDKEAHIRRVPRVNPVEASGMIEVYKKNDSEFNRIKDCIADYDEIWSKAKDINETQNGSKELKSPNCTIF